MNDVFLFVNPIAGRGRGSQIAQRLAAALARYKLTVHTFDKAPYTISDAELRTDAPPVAAITIGGDGTLRAVVERLSWFYGNDLARVPPMLVVPLGTANLMCQHLGIKWDDSTLEASIADALLNRNITLIDAARANDRLFLLMAGVGIDAMVVHELDRLRSGPIDLTSYAMPALLAIQNYAYPPLSARIDGQSVLENEPAMAFIGNVPEYGTRFPILSRARTDDGLLDLCILPCHSRAQVLRLLMAAATGDHVNEEGVIYMKGKSIQIDSSQQVPVQIDGEASGHTPLKVDLLPSRLPFIVQ